MKADRGGMGGALPLAGLPGRPGGLSRRAHMGLPGVRGPAGRLGRVGLLGLLGLLSACGAGSGEGIRGQISLDGSSSVYPIAEAVAEEFQLRAPQVMVAVGRSGTRGGLERFCRGETDVATASRPITETEAARCAANGIHYLELPVAMDGISILVNPRNSLVECLTMEELRRIWRPGSTVRTWRDVRPELPPEPIQLYGPGTDSGTFDLFTEAVTGEAGAIRADFHASEDDNVLARGLIGDRYSLGYFGYAYVEENREELKVLGVDGGGGCVRPGAGTILDGSYAPLIRRLVVYVNGASLEEPGVRALMEFLMTRAEDLIPTTGLVPLPSSAYRENLAVLQRAAGPPAGSQGPSAEGASHGGAGTGTGQAAPGSGDAAAAEDGSSHE